MSASESPILERVRTCDQLIEDYVFVLRTACQCDSTFVAGTPQRDEQGRPLCIECERPCATTP